MKSQKEQIILIINKEINQFNLELRLYINNGKYKEAKIAAKALKRLNAMVLRIQIEV